MPQATNIILPVGATISSSGGTTTTYAVAGTQNGTLPTIFEAGSASGNLLFADTISHMVSNGPSNRNISIKGVKKTVGPVSGVDTLLYTNSWDVKFQMAKAATEADCLALVDMLIQFLRLERLNIAKRQSYF